MRDFLRLLGKSFAIVFGSGLALLLVASVAGLFALGAWHVFRQPSGHAAPTAVVASSERSSNNEGVLRLQGASYEMKLPDETVVTHIPESMPPAEVMHRYWLYNEPCPPKYPGCDASMGVRMESVGNCAKDGCYLFSKGPGKGLLGWISRSEISTAQRLLTKK